MVILTSGTTGTPKGAARKQPDSLEPVAALFSKIPLRARETTMIAAPMFHSWGFAHFTLGAAARLDARAAAQVRPGGHAAGGRPAPRDGARAGAGDAAADPRPRRRRRSPATTLERAARSSRSAARRCRASWPRARWTPSATCSTTSTARPRWRGRRSPRPEDLRAAPGTAGRPPLGTVVKLLDEHGREVAAGRRAGASSWPTR